MAAHRGDLHRVPDISRQWVMPRRTISLMQFRSLLRRRSKALSALTTPDQLAVTTTIPPPLTPPSIQCPPRVPSSPPPPPSFQLKEQGEGNLSSSACKAENRVREDDNLKGSMEGEEGADCVDEKHDKLTALDEKVKVKGSDAAREHCNGGKPEGFQAEMNKQEEKCGDQHNNNKIKMGDEIEKRQKEIVLDLVGLNKKKHNLVRQLKQILSAEEDLKKRGGNQVPPRPSLPLQVDVTKDSGSLTRQPTPRSGSDLNVTEAKGGADDNNMSPVIQPRQSLRLSSTSPSAESAQRRAPHFQVPIPHPSRSSAFAAGSPSRFAPTAGQSVTQPPNLPALSVSGTNYAASSPSPAASGGTSTFRDTRHSSPWN